MRTTAFLAAGLGLVTAPLAAETAPGEAPAPIEAVAVQQAPSDRPVAVLPANTPITLRVNQEITTKGKTWNEGDNFQLTVAQDIFLHGYIVIPKGSRGVGRITFLTSKGAFGKSGKMDLELEYIEVNGRRIDVDGKFRQEGEGNTVATGAAVLAVGLLGGFVTGKSAVIPQGRELTATLQDDLAVTLPKGAIVPQAASPAMVVPVGQASN